ncbi:Hypothetical protein R9X50_00281500 [Acrodontium crateriforme]|uniref:type I protein arginine methyltransferase n=1 Tax=Acrodontium crateriforme TaxID=150365 RepID=A0AAQ3M2W0_9PEZI|nr:Hypothetical protein R9X50_00281500 [Acrodontium crateriforme]
MENLPAGWTVSNSSGSYAGPAHLTLDEEMVLDDLDGLDVRPDSPGWEDMEDDTESVVVQSLLTDEKFPSAKVMLEECKTSHGFDLLAVRKGLDLDFYQTIKLVNYIRSEVANGNASATKLPNVSDPSLWADDKYLQPALEDDALLFSLDELLEESELEKATAPEEGEGHQVAAIRTLAKE